MASASSHVADNSPDVRSPEASTPAGDVGTGVKRAPDEHVDGQEQAPGAAATAGVNKKKTAMTNRGVANLTPEQLAKKRANDREAQRAIRERTKNQIETLERRIEELTNQKPYQELQVVVRAKEAVEMENADMKRQLASIMAMLKPIVGSVVEEATPPQHRPHTQSVSVAQSPCSHLHGLAPTSTPASSTSPAATSPPDGNPDPAISQLHSQQLQLRQGLSMRGEKLGLDFLLRPGQLVNRVQASSHGAQDTPQYHHVPMKHDWVAITDDRRESWPPLSASRLTDYAGHAADQQASGPHHHHHHRQHSRQHSQPGQSSVQNLPFYSVPIKNSESTCPLDTILLNFLGERRQRIAEGLPIHEVIGPRYPSVSSLLNPAHSAYSHPLSKVFTDVLARFPDISRLPERIAVLYVMFLTMRWQISPTRENYERLPEWMAPQQSQLDCEHPAWIDHIPFPAMRERLSRIYKPAEYELEQFFLPYTTTLRVNWPYEETDALLLLPDSDDVIINPVFERHVRNIDNWKLGESFARAFPGLQDTFGLDPSI